MCVTSYEQGICPQAIPKWKKSAPATPVSQTADARQRFITRAFMFMSDPIRSEDHAGSQEGMAEPEEPLATISRQDQSILTQLAALH
jgi:hypothetical protein